MSHDRLGPRTELGQSEPEASRVSSDLHGGGSGKIRSKKTNESSRIRVRGLRKRVKHKPKVRETWK